MLLAILAPSLPVSFGSERLRLSRRELFASMWRSLWKWTGENEVSLRCTVTGLVCSATFKASFSCSTTGRQQVALDWSIDPAASCRCCAVWLAEWSMEGNSERAAAAVVVPMREASTLM